MRSDYPPVRVPACCDVEGPHGQLRLHVSHN
jgi:hypothetical protein